MRTPNPKCHWCLINHNVSPGNEPEADSQVCGVWLCKECNENSTVVVEHFNIPRVVPKMPDEIFSPQDSGPFRDVP